MLKVTSEVARLKRVVVQRPGDALAHMLPRHIEPGSAHYLLFDDLVHVPDAQKEHDQMCQVLGTSAEVGFWDELLVEVLHRPEAREFVIDEVGRLEELPGVMMTRMAAMEPEELATAVVVGAGRGGLHPGRAVHPLPNLIFARDLAAVAGDLLIVGNARKKARHRESILMWAIAEHHPWFEGADLSRNSRYVRQIGGSFPLTVEGGDVLVLSDSLVLIGASERTSWSMILGLGKELLERGFTRVLVVEMPKQRSAMHLDTVFTLADWDTAVVYGPLLKRGGREEANVFRIRASGDELAVDPVRGDLLDALAQEGHPMQAVLCGGGHPLHEEREQWTDGSNFVALSPGVVLGYARNVHTAAAMERAGFTSVTAQDFLKLFQERFGGDFQKLTDSRERYLIQIIGSELSRGRGGPRCLTMPLEREV